MPGSEGSLEGRQVCEASGIFPAETNYELECFQSQEAQRIATAVLTEGYGMVLRKSPQNDTD